jgi:hypothetical protein
MRTIILGLLLSFLTLGSLTAQIQPIDHNMKNLKVGNAFLYREWTTVFRPFETRYYYFAQRIIKHDTIDKKVYAVYQNGVRERADSSGVYWIPRSYDSTKPFTKEYLRYPLVAPNFPGSRFILLNCSNFYTFNCYPEDHPIFKPRTVTIYSSNDSNFSIFGFKVRGFSVSSSSSAQYATFVGVYRDADEGVTSAVRTNLCGVVIEGKYYGDSACLVASSTPLQGAEFTTLTASLAPNPVSDIATVRFILPTAQGLTVEICDMLGRQLAPPLVFDALSSGMNALPIDVSSIPRGIYAVRLRTALGLRATTMFVKE